MIIPEKVWKGEGEVRVMGPRGGEGGALVFRPLKVAPLSTNPSFSPGHRQKLGSACLVTTEHYYKIGTAWSYFLSLVLTATTQ